MNNNINDYEDNHCYMNNNNLNNNIYVNNMNNSMNSNDNID